MGTEMEDLDEKVPAMVPLTTRFENALMEILEPIKAIRGMWKGLYERAREGNEALHIGCAIDTFLEQLSYLTENSYVGDKAVLTAEVRHLFTIQPIKTEDPKKKTKGEDHD